MELPILVTCPDCKQVVSPTKPTAIISSWKCCNLCGHPITPEIKISNLIPEPIVWWNPEMGGIVDK